MVTANTIMSTLVSVSNAAAAAAVVISLSIVVTGSLLAVDCSFEVVMSTEIGRGGVVPVSVVTGLSSGMAKINDKNKQFC